MNYRERLRNIREDNDLTQTQIGKILNKSQQGYNHIEAGRAELRIEDLLTLPTAKAGGFSVRRA